MRERSRLSRRAWWRRAGACATPRASRAGFGVESLEARALLTAGTLDPTFGAGGIARAGLVAGEVAALSDAVLLPGGKILAAGTLRGDSFVARYHPDGSLDTTFGAGGGMVRLGFGSNFDGDGPHLAVQGDGKILVGGNDTSYVGLARLLPDGRFDPGFGNLAPGRGRIELPSSDVYAMALQPDGKVLLAGGMFANPGYSDFMLARFTADGSPDAAFDGDGWVRTDMAGDEDVVYGLALLPDGRVLAAGRANYLDTSGTVPQGRSSFGAARYNADGSPDTTFGGGDGRIGAAAGAPLLDAADVHLLRSDGRFVLAGIGADGVAVARFASDGTPDTTFGGGDAVSPGVRGAGIAASLDLAVAPDGSLVVGGRTQVSVNAQSAAGLVAKFTAAGDLDASFGDRGGFTYGDAGPFAAVAVRGDGRILAAGQYGPYDLMLRSFTAAGAPDAAFGGGDGLVTGRVPRGSDELARDVLVQPDGKVVVAGFSTLHDFTTTYLNGAVARFNPDGTPDAGFGTAGVAAPEYGPDAELWYAAELLPDGKLLLAGTYANATYTTHQRLFARLNPDGSLDAGFGAGGFALGGPGAAYEVAALPGGKFLASGNADERFEGGPWLERYDAGGGRDTTFPTLGYNSTIGAVLAILPLPDGRFYAAAGDEASIVGPHPLHPYGAKLFRFNADGTPDATFGGSGRVKIVQFNDEVRLNDLAVDAAGRVVAAGTIGHLWDRAAVYRYLPDGNPDPDFGGGAGVVKTDLPDGREEWSGVAIGPGGEIVTAGYVIRDVPGPMDMAVQRLNADGSPDEWFGEGGIATFDFGEGPWGDSLAGVEVLPDGRILAGGTAPLPPLLPVHRPSSEFAVLRVLTEGIQANAGGPYYVTEGSDLAVSARGTTLPGRSPARWEWDFDYDGTSFDADAEGRSVTVPAALLPDGPATRRVAVRLTDSAGDAHVDDALIHVANVSPQTSVSGNAAGQAGVPYTLSFTSSDPGQDSLTWSINWGDSNYESFPNNAAGATHTYADGRHRYVIVATAVDEDGIHAVHEVPVVIDGPNDVPAFTLLTVPATTDEGNLSYFVHGTFTDPDTADAHTVTIDWGRGDADTVIELPAGPGPYYQFSARHYWGDDTPSGTPEDGYTVTVTLTDGTASVTETRQVVVRNAAPVVQIGPDRTIAEGQGVSIPATVTDTPLDVVTHVYRWTVASDNGDVVPASNAPQLSFVPRDSGVYTVTLTVSDDDGGVGTDVMILKVADVAPSASATVPPTADEGKPYTVTFAYSDPGDDPVTGWIVDWGDGAVETVRGASATHVYADGPAGHRVVVSATNDDGVFPATVWAADLDPAFGNGGKVLGPSRLTADVALQPDGKIVVARGGQYNETAWWALYRYNADGTPDATFGTNGAITTRPAPERSNAAAVLVLADGKILVGGSSPAPGGGVFPLLARYRPDGSLDATFGEGGYQWSRFGLSSGINHFWDLAFAPDGKIVAAGSVTERAANLIDTDFFAARFNADGTPDLAFGAGGRTAAVDFTRRPDRATGIAVMPDGKIVVGGETDTIEQGGFSGYVSSASSASSSRFGLAGFNADGTVNTNFGTGGKVATAILGGFSWVRRLAAGPGGTVVAAGTVMKADRTASTWTVARYRGDGSLDPTFDGDGIAQTAFGTLTNSALALVVSPDGGVLVGGGTATAVGRSSFAFARYTRAGQPDPKFGNGGKLTTPLSATAAASATALAVLPGGGFVAAGYDGMTRHLPPGVAVAVRNVAPVIAALPDRTVPEGVLFTADGSAVDVPADAVVGHHWRVRDAQGATVFEADGARLSFVPDDGVYTLEFTASDEDGATATDVAILTVSDVAPTLTVAAPPAAAEGSPYTVTLGAAGGGEPLVSWTIDWGDGTRDVLPGDATSATHVYADGPARHALWVRLTDGDGTYVAAPTGAAPGALDAGFGGGGKVSDGSIGDAVVQPDGKVVAIHGGEPLFGIPWRVRRFNADGTPDASFGAGGSTTAAPHASARIVAVALQPDGKIVVAGYSPDAGGKMKPALARYHPDGSVDASFGAGGFVVTPFGAGAADQFTDVTVLPDGRIVAAGHAVLDPARQDEDFFVARFRPDGSLDPAFGAAGGRTAPIDFGGQPNRLWKVAALPDGRVVVSGEASTNGPLAVARLTPDGRLDPAFGTGGKVAAPAGAGGVSGQALAVLPDGSVYVAGYAQGYGGNFGAGLARLRADGSLDPAFDGDGVAAVDFLPRDLAVQSDGAVLVGGGVAGSFVIRRFLDGGAADPAFGAGGKVQTPMPIGFATYQTVRALQVLPDGRLVAAGYGGVARYFGGARGISVDNVAPGAVLAAGPAVAGRPVTVSFSGQSDPSAVDSAAGFRYGYDFNNDGDFADAGEAEGVADASRPVTLPAGTHTVRGRIADKDGGSRDYTLTFTVAEAEVLGRHVFYNNSFYDGGSAAAGAADDGAIAADKAVLLPGQEAVFANVSTYSRGINGLMLDLRRLPDGAAPGAADFALHVLSNGAWVAAGAAPAVSVRHGAGAGGSDRVTLILPDGAVRNTWLRVTVKATANTGLSSPDVFHVGHLGGETTGDVAGAARRARAVDGTDLALTRAHFGRRSPGALARFDFTRDGVINAMDVLAVRANQRRTLPPLPPPAAAAASPWQPPPPRNQQPRTRGSILDAPTTDVLGP